MHLIQIDSLADNAGVIVNPKGEMKGKKYNYLSFLWIFGIGPSDQISRSFLMSESKNLLLA